MPGQEVVILEVLKRLQTNGITSYIFLIHLINLITKQLPNQFPSIASFYLNDKFQLLSIVHFNLNRWPTYMCFQASISDPILSTKQIDRP